MADSNYVLSRGFDVASGQTIAKRRFVKLSAAETVTPVAAASDVPVGVARFDVSTAEVARGKGAEVQMMGIAEVEASVALAVGVLVGISANGRAAAAGAGVRTVGMVVGNPSTNAGDVISVMLNLPGLLGVGA